MMSYTISTEGLHCGHCEASVEGALLRVAGVDAVDADHETNTVAVSTREPVDTELLRAAVEGAGTYRVVSIAPEGHR